MCRNSIADELRGQCPVVLMVLKDGMPEPEQQLEETIVQLVKEKIGAVAFFKNIADVKRLPKTGNGKILRKTICQIADGKPYSGPFTFNGPSMLDKIAMVLAHRKLGNACQ